MLLENNPEKENKNLKLVSEKTMEEMFKEKWKWYEYPEIWFRRGIQVPLEDAIAYIKRFWQRGKRGWGDSDLWGMHYYLTETILTMLIKLQKIQHGYPATLQEDTEDKWEYNFERWKAILQEMIDGFTILRNCDTDELDIQWGGDMKPDMKLNIETHMKEKYPNWRYTTTEEEAKVKRAFELLSKYYFGLWD